MSAVDVVRNLAITSNRIDKEQILLNAWMSGERDFFIGAQLAYDILVDFGVTKVAHIMADDSSEIETNTFDFSDFTNLANKLRRRELVGIDAKKAIHLAAENSDTGVWNDFYRNILLQDLRCGVTVHIINKILMKISKSDRSALDYVIPVFRCKLAKDVVGDECVKVVGRKMLDVKLDGIRIITVVDTDSGLVSQYTGNGQAITTFPHIVRVFEQLMPKLPCSMVFDGKITTKSYQSLMGDQSPGSNQNSNLALFDCAPLMDFKFEKSQMTQQERHAVLSGYFGLITSLSVNGEVYVIPKISVDLDTPEGSVAFDEFNRDAIASGFAYIMIKDPDAKYDTKRNASWLKVKSVVDCLPNLN